jgi:hypothetical protein
MSGHFSQGKRLPPAILMLVPAILADPSSGCDADRSFVLVP